jgi:probable F420-dependent oxidoreductase
MINSCDITRLNQVELSQSDLYDVYVTKRLGITIPLEGMSLKGQADIYRDLENWGYTDFFSAEADSLDAFTPLALAASFTNSARLGSAVVPVFTRGPALLAMSAQAINELAPGRFILGIGSSSDVIVKNWNSFEFKYPLKKVKDTIKFLRKALAGETVQEDFDTFSVKRFKLRRQAESFKPPKIFIGALRKKMLSLGGELADGVIINWLGADDVPKVTEIIKSAAEQSNRETPEIVARIFVIPSSDQITARSVAKYMLNAYLNVEVYKEFHKFLGHSLELQATWDAWLKGDRKKALGLIPDQFADSIIIHGDPSYCAKEISRYVQNGVDTPVVALVPIGGDQLSFAKELAEAYFALP